MIPADRAPFDAALGRLRGARCRVCDTVVFPAQASCPACTGTDMAHHHLAAEGVLWTWTTQGFPPKPPYAGIVDAFEPYAVGYVDLGGEVLVEGRILADELRIGMPLRAVPWALATAEGPPLDLYAFVP